MNYTAQNQPQGYECFGRLYEEHDKECRNCPHNYACRQEIFRQAVIAPPKSTQPPLPPISQQLLPTPPPRSIFGQQQTVQYQNQPHFRQPIMLNYQPSAPTTTVAPPAPAPQFSQPVAYSPPSPVVPQSQQQGTIPAARITQQIVERRRYDSDTIMIPPMDPHAGIIGQYPGETVAERFGKNVALRMVEAMFQEGWRFFHVWTWPKRL